MSRYNLVPGNQFLGYFWEVKSDHGNFSITSLKTIGKRGQLEGPRAKGPGPRTENRELKTAN